MPRRCITTFSIVARDPQNGDLGVAVQSKFPFVGALVPWARAGVGAIATQSLANLSYGPEGLQLLEQGHSADAVLRQLIEADEMRDQRQVGIVDRDGQAVAYTGSACQPWAGHQTGENFACQGNLLARPEVVRAMAECFQQSQGELAERLVSVLQAAQDAGGDRRGKQAAALYVVRAGGSYGGHLDRYIDLRVDDHADPIPELARLLKLHRFYLTRPAEEDYIPIDEALAAELQDTLRDLGYYDGPTTGQYDEMTRSALLAYGGRENLEERLDEKAARIDRETLAFIRRRREESNLRA